MKTELLDGERLLAEETANLFRGWEAVGGLLYVTNRRLIFESHAINLRRGVTEIPLPEVEAVRPRNTLGLVPNGMEVETRDGVRHRFVVWGRKRIIDVIEVCKSDVVWGGAAESRRARPPVPASDVKAADPGVRSRPPAGGTRRG